MNQKYASNLSALSREIFAVVCFAALFSVAAFAQLTTGNIAGTVSDPSGAAIPGATITVKNIDTGVARNLSTGANGKYEALSLPTGHYEVSATSAGFQTSVRKGIEITIGLNAVIDMALQVGEVSSSVTVTGEAAQVETTTATVSNLVDSKKVEDLPLNNRDLTQLSFLQPGVIKSPAGAGAFSGLGDKLSVAGSRGNQNIYLLDGVSNSDLSGNAQSASGNMAGAETIKEFQIVTNNYSAEYRSQAGAIVSAVTKSGTNKVHGSAYEFLRNDKVDAAKWEENKGGGKSAFRRNQFGGSLGGPVIKDKTFFFASYEGLRQSQGTDTQARVPDVNARNGILPGLAPITVNPAVKPYLALYPVPGVGNRIIADPLSRRPDGSVLLAATAKVPTTDDFGLGRIDHTFSSGKLGTISGTYNYDNGASSSETPPGVLGDLLAQGFTSRKHVVSVNHTSVISPSTLNEFKMGYSFTNPVQDIPLVSRDFSSLAFRPGRALLGEIIVNPLTTIGYRVNLSDYQQKLWSFKDGVSINRSNHAFRMGVDIEHYGYQQVSCSRGCNGSYTFNNLQAFLTATPQQLDVQLPGAENPDRHMKQFGMGSYIQDNWNVSHSLTLNLGLRHEFVTVPTEDSGLIAAMKSPYDAALYLSKEAQKLYPTFPTSGTVDGFYTNATKRSFSPRFGFAYAPGSKRTSLRGGFGIFYEHPMLYNLRTNIQEMPPFAQIGSILAADATAAGTPLVFPNAINVPALSNLLKGGSLTARVIDYQQKPAYIYRWSATLQREIGGGWSAVAGYTGSRALHLWQQSEPNVNRWLGWPTQPTGTKIFPLRTSPQYGGRINPNFSEIRYQYPNSNSFHNDLAVGLQKRLSRGFLMQASYTYSKTVDDGSGVTSTGDNFVQGQRGDYPWDMKLKRGLSSFDVRNSFSSNFSYTLPTKKDWTGVKSVLAQGWQMNGIITLSSGYPFSIEENRTVQVNAIGNRDTLRPDLVPNGNKNPINSGNPDQYVDPSQFSLPVVGTFGNLGRNTVISPGLMQFDTSFFKSFSFTENHKLQVRAEFFNLFNRPNFGAPVGNGLPNNASFVNTDGTPNQDFGKISYTRTSARQIQFALRYTF